MTPYRFAPVSSRTAQLLLAAVTASLVGGSSIRPFAPLDETRPLPSLPPVLAHSAGYPPGYPAGRSNVHQDTGNPPHWDLIGHVGGKGSRAVAIDGQYLYLGVALELSILDVSDPDAPKPVASLSLPDFARRIVVVDHVAYVAAGAGGLRLFDVADPRRPAPLGVVTGMCANVAVSGGFAYVLSEDDLRIVDVREPAQPVVVGHMVGGGSGIAVAGRWAFIVDFQRLRAVDVADPAKLQATDGLPLMNCANLVLRDGVAYVAAGMNGLVTVDVSDPLGPHELGRVAPRAFVTNLQDISLSGPIALLADRVQGWQAFNVGNPAIPSLLGPDFFASRFEVTRIGTAVAANAEHAFVALGSGGFTRIDLDDPGRPTEVGRLRLALNPVAVATDGGHAYLYGLGADGGGELVVVDVRDSRHLRRRGSVTCPVYEFARVAASGGFAYVAAGDLCIVDVADDTDPKVRAILGLGGVARDVAVQGDLLFLATESSPGLQIVDVHDPDRPVAMGSYATPGYGWSVAVSGTLAYVGDSAGHVSVLDVRLPGQPALVGDLDLRAEHGIAHLALKGTTLLALGYPSTVFAADISDPRRPRILSSVAMASPGEDPLGARLIGDVFYIADHHLVAVSAKDPTHLEILTEFKPTYWLPIGVAGGGTTLFVADRSGALQAVDASDPRHPAELGVYDPPTELPNANSVTLDGARAYADDGTGHVAILDVADVRRPRVVGRLDRSAVARQVAVRGDMVYLGVGVGLEIYDARDPAAPRLVGQLSIPTGSGPIVLDGPVACVLTTKGLALVDVHDPVHPFLLATVDVAGEPTGLVVAAHRAIVSSASYLGLNCGGRPRCGDLRVVDLANPRAPHMLGRAALDTPALDVAFGAGMAFVTHRGYFDGSQGLSIFDVSSDSTPRLLGLLEMLIFGQGRLAAGLGGRRDLVYTIKDGVGLESYDVDVVDVHDASHPRLLGQLDTPGTVKDLVTAGDDVYVADGEGGLSIFRLALDLDVSKQTHQVDLPAVAR